MSDISRIVDVVITRGSRGISSANFSTPLFLYEDFVATGTEIVQTFNSVNEVIEQYPSDNVIASAARAHFGQIGNPRVWKVGEWDTLVDTTPDDALAKIVAEDDDFYGVCVNDLSDATNIALVATWCQDNGKFLFTASSEGAVLTGSSENTIPGLINTDTASKKAFCIYNSNTRADATIKSFPDVAYASLILGKTIGSYTGEFKTIDGIIPDKFTGTQRGFMEAINTARYNEIYGRNVVENARVLDGNNPGEYLDTEIGVDWLKTRMTEAVFTLIVNSDKVAMTDSGVASLQSVVTSSLQTAVDVGFLASFTVDAPSVSTLSTQDRAERKYNALTWTAVLAGAIHSTQINGTVEV